MAELTRFHVLGPLLVESEGRALAMSGARRRALLIRLLIAANEVVPADLLAEDLWEGAPSSAAPSTLRSHILLLRRALGPERILSHGRGYRLVLERGELDAASFEDETRLAQQILGRGDARRAVPLLRQALGRWRGAALADVAGVEWARGERARLDEERASAVETLLDARLTLGERHGVIVDAERAVAEHPLRERRWAQLMLAQYRSSRQADALRTFQRLRAHLGEELGIEPSAELVALENAMVLQLPELEWHRGPRPGPTAAPTRRLNPEGAVSHDQVPWPAQPRRWEPSAGRGPIPPNNLPGVGPLIGRTVETGTVGALLDRHRLVTLTGPGGVGKTRLAGDVARRRFSSSPDGVWLVDLATLERPEDVAPRVAQVVGAPEPGDDLPGALVEHLRERRVLLLIDNCEHVIGATAVLVASLLAHCPHLSVLATSREPLRIDGEHVHQVSPLSVPPEWIISRRELERSDAVALFVERVNARRPVDPAEDAQAIGAICRRLGGLPLALELAAARVGASTLAEGERNLANPFGWLTIGRRDVAPRHRTLWDTIDWSYRLLSAPEQAVFDRLGVFDGGFDQEAAVAVCSGDELQAAEVPLVVASLVDKSLVDAELRAPSARYSMLGPIRQFATIKLTERGDDAVRTRSAHVDHYLARALRLAPALAGPDQVAVLHALERDADNIGAVFRRLWHEPGRTEDLSALLVALKRFWFWRPSRAHRAFVAFRDQTVALAPRLATSVLCTAFEVGVCVDYPAVRELPALARALAERTGDTEHIVHAAIDQAAVAWIDGDPDQVDTAAHALSRARATGNVELIGHALSLVSRVDPADAAADDWLSFARASGDVLWLYDALSVVGRRRARAGQADAALACLREADRLGLSGLALWDPSVIVLMAWIRLDQGEIAAATDDYLAALPRALRAQLPTRVHETAAGLACCADHAGRDDIAARLHGYSRANQPGPCAGQLALQDRSVERLRRRYPAFESEYAIGTEMSDEELYDYVCDQY